MTIAADRLMGSRAFATGTRMSLTVLALLLALFAVGSPRTVQAQQFTDVADEADTHFRLGIAAYRAGDFEKALSHYFMSNRLAPNRNVLFNIARCYEELDRFVEAYRYYDTYASAEDTTEQELAEANKALARVSRSVSLLQVTSEPPGATLYIDRKELGGYGTTPRSLALAPGTYKILLEREGYLPQAAEGVVTKVGEQTELKLTLERIRGEVELQGEPAGARVRIEDPAGEVNGVLPGTFVVTPGEHKAFIEAEGYMTEERVVRVEANAHAVETVSLERERGTIVVQSEENDALITVDGRPVGFTPAVVDGVTSGPHKLAVQASGFRPFAASVEVLANQRVVVEVNLEVADEVAAASRTSESLQEAPASVTLIGKREIEGFAYTNVGDALLGVRGLFPNSDLTYDSFGFRGVNPFGQYGNRVQVQLDGHILNDDWIGASFLEYDLLTDLHMVEQLEVVRGPGSVLYGTGALFGVINLVTPSQPLEHHARGGISTVENGAVRVYADTSAPLGDSGGVWVSAGGLEAQGQDYYSPSNLGSSLASDGIAREVGGFDAANGLAKVWVGPVTLEGYFQQRDKQIPTGSFGTLFNDPRTSVLDRRAFAEVRYEPQLSEEVQLLTRAFYDFYHYEGAFAYLESDGGLLSETYDGHWLGLEARTIWQPLPAARLTFGSEYQFHYSNQEFGTAAETPDEPYLDQVHPFHQLSGYANADWTLTSWLGLSGGVRFDSWWIDTLPIDAEATQTKDQFLFSVNPRLVAVLTPAEGSVIKVLGGRAFRAPSVYELTYNDGGFTQVPSPDLVPEIVTTGELEVSQHFGESFWLTAAGFFSHISELIVIEGAGDETDPLHFVNQAAPVLTLGGELELRREFRLGWMLVAQYSFQRTRIDALFDGEQLPNSPTHMGSVKLVAPITSRALRLASRVSTDLGRLDRNLDEADPAVLWDLTLSGEGQGMGLRYSIGVRNLLDWRYTQPVGDDIPDLGVPQAGRTFQVEVSAQF